MRRRVLVLTRDLIPTPGRPVTGGGLRAWGLGEALRGRGHDVVYSVPRGLVPDGEELDELRRLSFEPDELHRTLLRAEPDVVLVEQWGLATYLQEITVPLILDLHGSLILENAFRRHRSLTSNAAAKIKALHKADLVICPAVRQRAYFMSWLMMSGADPTDIPIEVVPVSMPPELPEHHGADDGPLTLVHGGQLWPWIEPEASLRAVAEALDETAAGTCQLFVDEPERVDVLPYDTSTKVRSRPLSEELTAHPSVKVVGKLSHDRLMKRYEAADIAVDVYGWNTERELAYTTRTVEYMWCGLPVIYGDYGELAQLIRDYDAGWVVPPDDIAAIRDVVRQAAEDRAEVRRRGENAQRLVRERLTWDRTVEPLDRFVRDPIVRDKGQTIFGRLALEFDRIGGESRERISELERQVAGMGHELSVRESRLNDLSTELSRQDRRYAELVERHGREAAEWDRDRRQTEQELAELRTSLGQTEDELRETREALRCEQDSHGQTSAWLEAARNETAQARRVVEDKAEEIEQLRSDLTRAVDLVSERTAKHETRVETLEQQLREVSQRELQLRTDLAGEVVRSEGLRGDLARALKQAEAMQEQVREREQALARLKDHWLQRGAATGQHSLRRVAVQVPSLAGLFVRNLANNAYMTIWQKRHNVRIFPGQ